MAWVDPLVALILAVLIGVLLVGVLGWRHPRARGGAGTSLLFILLLLFPLVWAAAMWAAPVGPTVLGAAVVPPLLVGLLIAITAAVLNEPRPSPAREGADADAAETVFGALFWIFLLIAAGVIVAGYVLE